METRKFKITNPYGSVTELIGEDVNHYKTNLHTHSTYSDANNTMTDMINAAYDLDFDILAITEHGILGKEWDKEPSKIPLYFFQNLWHGKRRHPSTEHYKALLDGTYKTAEGKRTKKRGIQCVPDAIEANMLVLVLNHVNGFFTNDVLEGKCGKENNYETPIKVIEESGGISHINHPTDWLRARRNPNCAKVPENIAFFADLFRRYKSCVGMEVLNMYDIPNRSDRILWDELLKVLIPEGERSVWGFSNSDAHRATQIDTAFMDFILPEYSLKNLRTAMETGTFFSIARYAKNELGEDFVGRGACPVVTQITVDDDADTITIKGINCKAIEWIADGEIIQSETLDKDGEITTTIKLADHGDKISCYVRAQLKGDGGICLTQPFICDDGDIARFKKTLPMPKKRSKFFDTRLGVIVDRKIINR